MRSVQQLDTAPYMLDLHSEQFSFVFLVWCHNLEGPVLIETLADEPWIAPDEGSLKQVVFRKACAPR